MSSDAKDKPYAPSQQKLDEARKRGEVPQVKDAPLVASMAFVCALLLALSDWLMSQASGLLDSLLALAFMQQPGSAPVAAGTRLAGQTWVLISAVLLFAAGLVGTLTKWLLVGPVVSAKPVTPDFQRINPVSGFKRIFSGETWFSLLKSLVCAAVIGLALMAWLLPALRHVMTSFTPLDLLAVSGHLLLRELGLGCIVLAVFAVADLMYQRWTFMRNMRMDHKDLHDEHKQQEGSPEVKSERKQEHRRLLSE